MVENVVLNSTVGQQLQSVTIRNDQSKQDIACLYTAMLFTLVQSLQ